MSLARVILHALYFIDATNSSNSTKSILLNPDRYFPSTFNEYDEERSSTTQSSSSAASRNNDDDDNDDDGRTDKRNNQLFPSSQLRIWPQLASVAFLSFGFRNAFVPRIVSLTPTSFCHFQQNVKNIYNSDLSSNILITDSEFKNLLATSPTVSIIRELHLGLVLWKTVDLTKLQNQKLGNLSSNDDVSSPNFSHEEITLSLKSYCPLLQYLNIDKTEIRVNFSELSEITQLFASFRFLLNNLPNQSIQHLTFGGNMLELQTCVGLVPLMENAMKESCHESLKSVRFLGKIPVESSKQLLSLIADNCRRIECIHLKGAKYTLKQTDQEVFESLLRIRRQEQNSSWNFRNGLKDLTLNFAPSSMRPGPDLTEDAFCRLFQVNSNDNDDDSVSLSCSSQLQNLHIISPPKFITSAKVFSAICSPFANLRVLRIEKSEGEWGPTTTISNECLAIIFDSSNSAAASSVIVTYTLQKLVLVFNSREALPPSLFAVRHPDRTNLEYIHICIDTFKDENLVAVAESFPLLKRVTIENTNSGSMSGNIGIPALAANCERLVVLRLPRSAEGIKLPGRVFQAAAAGSQLKNLRHLSLDLMSFDDSVAAAVSSGCDLLQVIDLNRVDDSAPLFWHDADADCGMDMIMDGDDVFFVPRDDGQDDDAPAGSDVEGPLTDEGLRHLVKLKKTLKVLNLQSTRITDDVGMKKIIVPEFLFPSFSASQKQLSDQELPPLRYLNLNGSRKLSLVALMEEIEYRRQRMMEKEIPFSVCNTSSIRHLGLAFHSSFEMSVKKYSNRRRNFLSSLMKSKEMFLYLESVELKDREIEKFEKVCEEFSREQKNGDNHDSDGNKQENAVDNDDDENDMFFGMM